MFGAPSGILDPHGLLARLDWRCRDAFERMASRYYRETGKRFSVQSTRRSCTEQAQLYAIGRTQPGAVVTHAKGCLSWHVAGRAIDALIILPSGERSWNQADYERAGRLWESAFGGVWGGDFEGFGPGGDAGHFEYHPGQKIAEVCPNPDRCSEVDRQIQTLRPMPLWLFALLGATVIGAGVYGWQQLHAKLVVS